MVDAKRAACRHDGTEHLADRHVARLPQPARIVRDQAPVLSLQVPHVRRRADRRFLRQQVPVRPGFGSDAVDADGKVLVQADAHVRFDRRVRGGAELPVAFPLQILKELDAVLPLGCEKANRFGLRNPELLRPGAPIRLPREPLAQRFEQREPCQRSPPLPLELPECLAARARRVSVSTEVPTAEGFIKRLQHGQLEGRDVTVMDQRRPHRPVPQRPETVGVGNALRFLRLREIGHRRHV